MEVTATATNPTEASASVEASPAPVAAATGATDNTQQPQIAQAQPAVAAEPPVAATQNPEPAPAAVVPEAYSFTAPEGTTYDPGILEAFSGAAKEAALTQAAAQTLIDKMAPAIAARQVDQVKAVQEEWRQASTSDKEFGGEKLQENLGIAKKAVEMFGTPELRTLLDQTGLGNHPEMLRLLYRAGKAISADTFVAGRAAGGADKTLAERLYPVTK